MCQLLEGDEDDEEAKPGSVEIQPFLLCSYMEQMYIYIYLYIIIYNMIFHLDFPMIFTDSPVFFEVTVFFYWAQSCILMGARELDQPKVRLGAALKDGLPDSHPVFLMCFFGGANLKSKSYVPKHECWNKPFFCDEMVFCCLQVRHKKW